MHVCACVCMYVCMYVCVCARARALIDVYNFSVVDTVTGLRSSDR